MPLSLINITIKHIIFNQYDFILFFFWPVYNTEIIFGEN